MAHVTLKENIYAAKVNAVLLESNCAPVKECELDTLRAAMQYGVGPKDCAYQVVQNREDSPRHFS